MELKAPDLPRLAYNWVSFLGGAIALIIGIAIAVLIGIGLVEEITNPYLGILVYLILPPVLVFGLLLIPVGMYLEWRRWQKAGEPSYGKWPAVDLNRPAHRNAVLIFLSGTTLFLLVSSVGIYQAYHFSESVTFCGQTCHEVMKPEYTTYKNSPHARVRCTSCHVGPGAGWYTKSKLSGAYQVYATLANVFPRPIPTPIKNLRPAQATCEQCHWPEKFFGAQQKRFEHFLFDSLNTRWSMDMLLKTGGGDPGSGQMSGIHWHINIHSTVEYIARDEKRQDIPWVRVTDRNTGESTIYQDQTSPLAADELGRFKPRIMDCMDCHNRPSHIFRSPDHTVDQALLTGRISSQIPEIKRIAVEALTAEYQTQQQAADAIPKTISQKYQQDYPTFWAQESLLVQQAAAMVVDIFCQSIFPEMKVKWSEYPDNIGHFIHKGCMRCHAGNHTDSKGKAISHACNSCHIILAQGKPKEMKYGFTPDGLEYQHPVDIDDAWREMGCFECHTGTQP